MKTALMFGFIENFFSLDDRAGAPPDMLVTAARTGGSQPTAGIILKKIITLGGGNAYFKQVNFITLIASIMFLASLESGVFLKQK